MASHEVKVYHSFMAEEQEKVAIETALQALEAHKQFKDIAMFVKQAFDKKFPSTTSTEGVFHCVCGTHFAGEDISERMSRP